MTPSAKKELTLTRIFDAPRELVFRAWTDPVQMAKWWGPARFTNPVCEFDARPGGAIKIHMQGPDGTVYPMGGTVHEVVAPEKIVFTSRGFEEEENIPTMENLNTVTFEDIQGKTKLTLHVVVMKSAPEHAFALSGMEEGWSGSLDKLAVFVRE